jgi:hypothetical protein
MDHIISVINEQFIIYDVKQVYRYWKQKLPCSHLFFCQLKIDRKMQKLREIECVFLVPDNTYARK